MPYRRRRRKPPAAALPPARPNVAMPDYVSETLPNTHFVCWRGKRDSSWDHIGPMPLELAEHRAHQMMIRHPNLSVAVRDGLEKWRWEAENVREQSRW